MTLTKTNIKTFYLMLLTYAFFAFISPLSPIFFVALCVIIGSSIFLLNDSDTICFLAFASCFMACFNIQSMFLKMLELVMALLIIKQLILAIKLKNNKNIAFICLLLLYCLIIFVYSLCVSHFKVYKLWQGLGIILIISTMYLIGNVNIKKLALTLSAGLLISVLLSLMAYCCGISLVPPFMEDPISGFRLAGYFDYVNALALYCSLCQACLLTLFITNKLNIKKWFWLLCIVTLIGLLTFSKSFISITAFTYFVAIILGFIKSNNKKKYIKLSLCGLVLTICLILVFHSYIEIIVHRFLDISNYSGVINIATTGRLDIWKDYFRYLIAHPQFIIFGRGITVDGIGEYTPHNLFISILYRFGIVGIGVFIAFAVFIIRQIKLNKSVYNYLPLLIVLINACFEDLSSSLFTCLPLIISLLFVLNKSDKHVKQ